MQKKLTCILIIDDDEPTNFLTRVIIEEVFCTEKIVTVQSAEEALNYLHSAQIKGASGDYPFPDLIFLDINMPCMDGWEFLDRYRHMYENGKPPATLIMLTTSFNPEDEIRAKSSSDIADYINKPLTHEIMMDVLREHFR
jgi:CheY-like chemotaxis protein